VVTFTFFRSARALNEGFRAGIAGAALSCLIPGDDTMRAASILRSVTRPERWLRSAPTIVRKVCGRRPLNRIVCWRVAHAASAVALTFDDGPANSTTPIVLEILAQHGARATFFVVGDRVEASPNITRRAVADGHEIGNHSYSHRPVRNAREVQDCDTVLRTLSLETRYFRPPGGRIRLSAFVRLSLAGHTTVFWSFDSRDSLRAEGKAPDVLPDYERVKSGDIVLMHDDNQRCVGELPDLLRILRAKNIQPVTLSTLLGIRQAPGRMTSLASPASIGAPRELAALPPDLPTGAPMRQEASRPDYRAPT